MRLSLSNTMARSIVCLISGAALALAYPYPNIWILAWIAPSALLINLKPAGIRTSALYGLLFGVGFFGVHLYWISTFGLIALIALTLFQSLFIILFAIIANLMMRHGDRWATLLSVPALWVCIEWLRSLGMFGFTWGDLGYSQYKFLPGIQIASIGGVWAVSYLLILFSTAIMDLYESVRMRLDGWHSFSAFVPIVLITAASIGFGYIRLNHPPEVGDKKIDVAIIQGDIDQGVTEDDYYIRRAWNTYTELTYLAAAHGAELVVWPETVVPGSMANEFVRERLSRLAANAGISILAGCWDGDDQGRVYNSAFLVDPGAGVAGKYRKMHLVPFGEYVPARKYAGFLRRFNVTPYDTFPGKIGRPLEYDGVKLGVSICFESTFPAILRQMVQKGAQVLCVTTNDCWYDDTAGAEQHMAFSVLRAVETDRYLVRAASTGISCFIDSRGRVLKKADVLQKEIISESVPAMNSKTFYAKYGDWLVILCIIIVSMDLIGIGFGCNRTSLKGKVGG